MPLLLPEASPGSRDVAWSSGSFGWTFTTLLLFAILLQFVMQCLQADPEYFGGARLVVVLRVQSFQDQTALGFGHRGADLQSQSVACSHSGCASAGLGGGNVDPALTKGWRQVRDLNRLALHHHHGSLQSVAQLTHVAGPTVTAEPFENFR